MIELRQVCLSLFWFSLLFWAAIMMSKYMVEYERERGQNGSCPVERMVHVLWREADPRRGRQWGMACLPPRAVVALGPGLLPRPMSGSLAPPQLGSSMSDVHGSGYHWRQCRGPESGLTPELVLVPKDHAVASTIQIEWAYTGAWGWGSHLGLFSHCSQGLCWGLCLLVPSKAVRLHRV